MDDGNKAQVCANKHFPSRRGEHFMKEAKATIEFIKDNDGSIYAWTPDGPYCLVTTLLEAKELKNGQTVKVKYDKYGQYAQLIG